MRPIPSDTRKRILARYDKGRHTRAEVAEQFDVSESLVKKLLKQRKRLGHAEPLYGAVGRKPAVTGRHEAEVREALRNDPGATLGELCALIGGICPVMAMHRALGRMRITYKKNAAGLRARPRGRPQGARGVDIGDGGVRRAIPRVH